MYDNMSKGHKALLRFIAALIVLIVQVAVLKLAAFAFNASFTDLAIFALLFNIIYVEMKRMEPK